MNFTKNTGFKRYLVKIYVLRVLNLKYYLKFTCLYTNAIMVLQFLEGIINLILMNKIQQMASCPFNKTHTFAKQKFVFHIARCKDRQKVSHLFQKCQYNPLHFILKQDIEMHECCCSSRQQGIKMMQKLKQTFIKSLREPRQRSRQKNEEFLKIQEAQTVKFQHIQEENLEQCQECQQILRLYKQKIVQGKNQKLKKFIMKYYELDCQL